MEKCECVGDGRNTIGTTPLGGGCCGGTGPAAYLVKTAEGTTVRKCTYCLVRLQGDEIVRLLVTQKTLPEFALFDAFGAMALEDEMESFAMSAKAQEN